jgi:hypothetical protein
MACKKEARVIPPRARATHADIMAWRLLAFVVISEGAWAAYASYHLRGLYADGIYYLFAIEKANGFSLEYPARMTVDVLREAPAVMLRLFTGVALVPLGQVFSLSMAFLPAAFVAVSWFVLPVGRKTWILLPILQLLTGAAASSFAAVGEGAIAAGYFWPMLFMLLFRTNSRGGRLAFLFICLPALFLHEMNIILMLLLLSVCVLRYKSAPHPGERRYYLLAVTLLIVIVVCEAASILVPYDAADRRSYAVGLVRLEFVLVDHLHRVNLPLITGSVALAVILISILDRAGKLGAGSLRLLPFVHIAFFVYAIVAVILPWLAENTVTPYAQMQARNHAIFVSALLGLLAIVSANGVISEKTWQQPLVSIIAITLCLTQASWEIAATDRWKGYIADFTTRLKLGTGLLDWEQIAYSGNYPKDRDWLLMSWSWTMPSMSILLSRDGAVRTMIAAPNPRAASPVQSTEGAALPAIRGGEDWQPFDPRVPADLPKLSGINYGPYIAALGQHL